MSEGSDPSCPVVCRACVRDVCSGFRGRAREWLCSWCCLSVVVGVAVVALIIGPIATLSIMFSPLYSPHAKDVARIILWVTAGIDGAAVIAGVAYAAYRRFARQRAEMRHEFVRV